MEFTGNFEENDSVVNFIKDFLESEISNGTEAVIKLSKGNHINRVFKITLKPCPEMEKLLMDSLSGGFLFERGWRTFEYVPSNNKKAV